ncbi:hypothetical protein D0962_37235 [Leptolyngbyaceae cyanobacterium CCMR0082]|uniref:Uncharacterized protein n=1 Tax=Adonisia turfae CCMR0082 TaxID=2304604 RepID=A0A6M0SK96_9CYAN|nr:hypothetical protein [Adonisia turfae]NEZ68313.1 hypothetical protein [Adonisia turfae CCMR0082]
MAWRPPPATGRTGEIDFDQMTEPSDPGIGQIWRERQLSGLTVGDWEWSGSLWLSVTRNIISDNESALLDTNNANLRILYLPINSFIETASIFHERLVGIIDQDNYLNWEIRVGRGDGFSNTSYPLLANGSILENFIYINNNIEINFFMNPIDPYDQGHLRITVEKVGSSGGGRLGWSLKIREVRR